jgi:hypothetical protein
MFKLLSWYCLEVTEGNDRLYGLVATEAHHRRTLEENHDAQSWQSVLRQSIKLNTCRIKFWSLVVRSSRSVWCLAVWQKFSEQFGVIFSISWSWRQQIPPKCWWSSLLAACLFVCILYLAVGSSLFRRNLVKFLPGYKLPHPRRWLSELWRHESNSDGHHAQARAGRTENQVLSLTSFT